MPGNSVALLLPDLRGGGAERVSIDLADALADLGHQVEFVLLKAEGELLAEARARHQVTSLEVDRARDAIGPLARYMRSRRPGALIAAMWPLTTIAPLAARLSGHRCPVLAVQHSTLSQQYASWGRIHRVALRTSLALEARLADAVAGVSRGVANDVAALAGCAPGKVRALYNPIRKRPNPEPDALAIAEAQWPCPPGKRIITVGTLKPVKNQALLLNAFTRLDDPEACLMLLGQGQLEADLRQQAQALGIADRVVFAGFHLDPTPFYLSADLFVLSSDYEGFGNVIVEALACGLPVVSTDCPSGPAEILEGGRYGHLAPVGDAPALANAMRKALAEPHDREALQRRAADFSPERAARAYLNALGFA